MSEEQTSKSRIKRKERSAIMFAMYCKGISQQKIAEALGVDQATVSRDLRLTKLNSPYAVSEYRSPELEMARVFVTYDEISKGLWELAEDKEAKRSERLKALTLLMKFNDKQSEECYRMPH